MKKRARKQTKPRMMRKRWETWVAKGRPWVIGRSWTVASFRIMRLQDLVQLAARKLGGSVVTYGRYAREDFFPYGPLRVFHENGRHYVYLARQRDLPFMDPVAYHKFVASSQANQTSEGKS